MFKDIIADRIKLRIGIIGLGYVGLPLAVAFAEAGDDVVGLDVDSRKIAALRAGESYVEDISSERLRGVDGRIRATSRHVRNVWVDVPIATYGVLGKGKTPAQDRLCQLAGSEVPLPAARLKAIYRDKNDYEKKIDTRLAELVTAGWFLPEYASQVTADADKVHF